MSTVEIQISLHKVEPSCFEMTLLIYTVSTNDK